MFKAVPVLCSGALLLTITPLLAQTNTLSIQSAAGGASILSPGSLATAYAVGMDATPTNGHPTSSGISPLNSPATRSTSTGRPPSSFSSAVPR